VGKRLILYSPFVCNSQFIIHNLFLIKGDCGRNKKKLEKTFSNGEVRHKKCDIFRREISEKTGFYGTLSVE